MKTYCILTNSLTQRITSLTQRVTSLTQRVTSLTQCVDGPSTQIVASLTKPLIFSHQIQQEKSHVIDELLTDYELLQMTIRDVYDMYGFKIVRLSVKECTYDESDQMCKILNQKNNKMTKFYHLIIDCHTELSQEKQQLSKNVNNTTHLFIESQKDICKASCEASCEASYRFILDKKSSEDYVIAKHILLTAFNSSKYDLKLLENDLMLNDQFEINSMMLKSIIEILVTNIEQNHNIYHEICPICHNVKDFNTMIVSPCEKCIPLSYDKFYDNTVLDLFNKDPNLFKLLLLTSLSAIDVKERFSPVPVYCLSGKYEIEKLGKHVVERDFSYYINHIQNNFTDAELAKLIKLTEYMFLKHIVLSNNTRLNYFNESNNVSVFCEAISVDDVWNKNDRILFTVDHPIHKQKRFETVNVVHMFHGSPLHNWYSIMRNGLKNYSGTNMMTTGQAHGPGVYLGADMNTSSSYCGASKEIDNQHWFIMGVVQVLNSEKYKKTPNIYVASDETHLLLKYLVMFKKSVHNRSYDSIQKYLLSELPHSIKMNYIDSYKITLKRLNKELSDLNKKIKKIHKENKDVKITVTTIDGGEKVVRNIVKETVTLQDSGFANSQVSDVKLPTTLQISETTFKVGETTLQVKNSNDEDKKCEEKKIKTEDADAIMTEWNISIKTSKDRFEITVQYAKTFPSTGPMIFINQYKKIPMLLKTSDLFSDADENFYKKYPYIYIDPVLRYDRWSSRVKVNKILYQLFVDIIH